MMQVFCVPMGHGVCPKLFLQEDVLFEFADEFMEYNYSTIMFLDQSRNISRLCETVILFTPSDRMTGSCQNTERQIYSNVKFHER